MTKFTKEKRAQILAEAHRHLAVRRAEFERRRKALLLQKKKMLERRRATETQQLVECNRDELLGFIAKLKGAIRSFEGGNNGFNGK
ncbi:hypothetical protein RX327_35135 [Bradyrhizobium sp. BEA-2-5]|uniref:hypothetical protein n=1 Tax=Bradyrhizobium sp. BEA-2-5 TaxID=3080015 RepID=UPI00293F5A6B|nr:hypothetical protein [Bradyrhizobium sp. BEA-2-5]WOH80920.1 hypothetical protein RX327_35135 [Bradyrhizobium sp. BEA-2-5]